MIRIGKSIRATLLVVAITLAAFLVLTFGCGKKEAVIEIGAILPLTGPSGQYGQWIQDALEMAKDEINLMGGIKGKQLEIIYEDDQAEPRLAANAMQKMVTIEKVPIVFGSWASSCVLAQAPIAERTHTPILAEAQSPKIRNAGDYVFRIQPDSRYYMKYLVPYVYDQLGIRTVAIIHVNNDYGSDLADVFKRDFEKLGGSIVLREAFEQGSVDFRAELTKIKAVAPEAVFVPAYTEAGYVLKQARELGIDAQFLGAAPMENPDILMIAGAAAEGVVYPHHFDPESPDPRAQQFQKKYEEKFSRKLEGYAALAYDALYVIAKVLEECGVDKECIKNTLYTIQDFPGVTGPTSFDDHGDVIKLMVIRTVENGQFRTLWRFKESAPPK